MFVYESKARGEQTERQTNKTRSPNAVL